MRRCARRRRHRRARRRSPRPETSSPIGPTRARSGWDASPPARRRSSIRRRGRSRTRRSTPRTRSPWTHGGGCSATPGPTGRCCGTTSRPRRCSGAIRSSPKDSRRPPSPRPGISGSSWTPMTATPGCAASVPRSRPARPARSSSASRIRTAWRCTSRPRPGSSGCRSTAPRPRAWSGRAGPCWAHRRAPSSTAARSSRPGCRRATEAACCGARGRGRPRRSTTAHPHWVTSADRSSLRATTPSS